LVEQLGHSLGRDVTAQPVGTKGFFDKVKDALGV
jgi:hypothetical protein